MASAPKKSISLVTTRYPASTTAIRVSSGAKEIGWSWSTDQIASRIAVAIIVGSADERTTNARVEEGNWARGDVDLPRAPLPQVISHNVSYYADNCGDGMF